MSSIRNVPEKSILPLGGKEKDENRQLRSLQSRKLHWLKATEAPITTIKKNVGSKELQGSAKKSKKATLKTTRVQLESY